MNRSRSIFGIKPGVDEATADRILRCPWKEDITIERSSWVGSGNYDSIAEKVYHSVTCAADGPNGDKEKTFHHSSIGYWNYFSSFEEANAFAVSLESRVRALTGLTPPVYASNKDTEAHASWCMGKRKTRPRGITAAQLPTSLAGFK